MASSPPTTVVAERCWTLIGHRTGRLWQATRVQRVVGEPTRVAFDAQWALQREEQEGDVVGFYHTHPSGCPKPSARDHRTMRAWVSALGKPLLCLIEADGCARAYRYADDESSGELLVGCELISHQRILVFDRVEEHDGQQTRP